MSRPTLLLAIVLAAVVVAFLPALRGGLVWDDEYYVQTNETIRSLSPSSLATLATLPQVGNYHPLTMLTLAVNYAVGGIDPFGYHLVNLLLHLANVVLVYLLMLDLSRRSDAALFACAFWGLHPLRVESVAWISGRKDVLYTGFFLAALLAYRRYARHPELELRSYLASLAAYVASLLSKGMAVSLALVLPLSDFLDRRPLSRRSVLDKTPFVVLSLVFGWLAIAVQGQAEAIHLELGRPLLDRIVYAGYAFFLYLVKTVWPSGLSLFYPFPTPPEVSPPALCWAFFAGSILVTALAVASLRFTRKIAFGFFFFAACVAFVLQVLPVGSAVAADRYTYLAAVGLAYLAGEGFARLRDLAPRLVPAIAVLVLAALGGATFARSQVWHDGATIWSDVIAKQPTVVIAYVQHGNAIADLGDKDGARRDYREAARRKPDYLLAHYDLAYLEGEMGNYQAAVDGFTKALALDPDMVWARLYRGDALLRLRRPQDALADYDRVVALAPELAPAYEGRARAWLLLGNRERALPEARRAQQLGLAPDPGLSRALGGQLP
jgi:tetratricopeptide (TPR) repeat protein